MPLRVFFLCALLAATGRAAEIEDVETVRVPLSLSPQRAEDGASYRLLPAAPELKEGNAAVVMLRMIWEQQPFLLNTAREIRELMELPYDDPKVREFQFGHFKSVLQRAAYMEDAEWHYPLEEIPMSMILLPDVQGLRDILGRGMSLWTRQQIAAGDHLAAIQAMRVQLACVRHVTQTPFVVVQLVGASMADMTLDNLESLISQPETPNLYWALAVLPQHLSDYRDTLQWDAVMLERSLPSLHPRPPALTDREAWEEVAVEFGKFLEDGLGRGEDSEALLERAYGIARKYLIEEQEFRPETLEKMGREAVVMRWILATNQTLHQRTETAYALPSPLAIKKLQDIEADIDELVEATDAASPPYTMQRVEVYLSLHRFNRRVKFLQAVEAIRDYAARNGRLPQRLDDVPLYVPRDPLTELPFEYEYSAEDESATLRIPLIPGVAGQKQRIYELTLQ